MKLVLILLSLTVVSYGRIGETPKECAQRYGIGMKDLGEGKEYFVTYFKNGFRIRVWFRNEKAGVVLYEHSVKSKELTKSEIATFLDANANGKAALLIDGENWKNPEAKDRIIYELSEVLVVSTQENLLAFNEFTKKSESDKMKGF